MKDEDKKFVILRHLTMPDKGKCFFTMNSNDDPTRSYKGDLWYEIIGYANSVKKAQEMCFDNYGGCPIYEDFKEYWKNKE